MVRNFLNPEPASTLTEATYGILAAHAEPRHGYAIMQWVGEATGQRVKLGPGTLYGALTALQGRGYIAPVAEGPEAEPAPDPTRSLPLLPEGSSN